MCWCPIFSVSHIEETVFSPLYCFFYLLCHRLIDHRRRQWQPNPVLLPRKSHGWRSLVGCSPWGREELDTIEWLHFHFSLSCIGEGNGIPLQCSCLENPRDRGAWWAAVYGVAQSRTRLKWLSSSNWPYVHVFISGIRIPMLWFMCQFLFWLL